MQAYRCRSSNARQRYGCRLGPIQWRALGELNAIQSTMNAAAQGQLVPVTRGRELGQIAFLKAGVSKYLGSSVPGRRHDHSAPVQGDRLELESVSHWINEGILNADQSFARGQPCRARLAIRLKTARCMVCTHDLFAVQSSERNRAGVDCCASTDSNGANRE